MNFIILKRCFAKRCAIKYEIYVEKDKAAALTDMILERKVKR